MLTQVAVDDPPVSGPAPNWGPIPRLAFRFYFVYALLYFGLSWLFVLPFTSALGTAIDRIHETISIWIGVHILHVSQPIDLHRCIVHHMLLRGGMVAGAGMIHRGL